MNVPFVDLKPAHDEIKKELTLVFEKTLASNYFVNGPQIEALEEKFAKYCGSKFSIMVNNGTSALYATLMALELPHNSEVILPVNTFIATAEAVILAGLTPVFVDINPKTYLINIEKLKNKISAKTKVVLPVNLYGQQTDLDQIKKLISRSGHKIFLIEDACQSHGAKYKGKRKLKSDFACYSFYPGKNLGALGESGAITTNSKKEYLKIKQFVNHGQKSKYVHTMVGTNLRSSELQAGFLTIKLKHLDDYNQHRVKIARYYSRLLAGISEIELPNLATDGSHVYHLFVIQAKKRKELIDYLGKNGIQTGIHYPQTLSQIPALRHFAKGSEYKVAESLSKQILSLPMYYGLSKDKVEYVCQKIRKFYG